MPASWKKERRIRWREFRIDGALYRWRLRIDKLEIELHGPSGFALPGHELYAIARQLLIDKKLYQPGDRKEKEGIILPDSKCGGAMPWSPKKRLSSATRGKKKERLEVYEPHYSYE